MRELIAVNFARKVRFGLLSEVFLPASRLR